MANGARPRLVLASASPRRHELCSQLGLDCELIPVDIDETPLQGEAPLDFVARMAREKAQTCQSRLEPDLLHLPVLGADTVVEIDGDILGKPADEPHAQQMLARLSGALHHVHTSVAIVRDEQIVQLTSSSSVQFCDLDAERIRRYIATGEPMDKAGAYAIQGIAARFVCRLEGSYTGVVGLPLYETTQLLAEFGIEL